METMLQRAKALFPQIQMIKYNLIESTVEPWKRTINLTPRRLGKTYVTNLMEHAVHGDGLVHDSKSMDMRMVSTNNPVMLIKKMIEVMDIDDLNNIYSNLNEIETLIKDSIEKKLLLEK